MWFGRRNVQISCLQLLSSYTWAAEVSMLWYGCIACSRVFTYCSLLHSARCDVALLPATVPSYVSLCCGEHHVIQLRRLQPWLHTVHSVMVIMLWCALCHVSMQFSLFWWSGCRPVGRPHSKSWILKVLGQLWADRCAQDIADPTQNAGKSVSTWA